MENTLKEIRELTEPVQYDNGQVSVIINDPIHGVIRQFHENLEAGKAVMGKFLISQKFIIAQTERIKALFEIKAAAAAANIIDNSKETLASI